MGSPALRGWLSTFNVAIRAGRRTHALEHDQTTVRIVVAEFYCRLDRHGFLARRVQHLQAERRAAYEAALLRFSRALEPGTSREHVENYLKRRNSTFSRLCCVEQQSLAYDDITKIGEEKPPWYCRTYGIYVAFQFVDDPPRIGQTTALPSDKLRKTTLFPRLEGCL